MDTAQCFWGYLTGAVLLLAGIALLVKKQERTMAGLAGFLVLLLVLFVYLPMLGVASKPSEMNEATNYIADTLFFAGTILVLGAALPKSRAVWAS